MTVTASTIDRLFAGTIALGNGEDIVGWSIFPGKALFQNARLFYPKILRPCDKNGMSLMALLYAVMNMLSLNLKRGHCSIQMC